MEADIIPRGRRGKEAGVAREIDAVVQEVNGVRV
jgi:hypothetical protein